MSFILDALKKSEERRRLHEEAHQPRQKLLDLSWSGQRHWPAWLLLAVLLIALAGGWWLRGAAVQPAAESQSAVPAAPPHTVPAAAGNATPPAREPYRPAPFAPVPAGSLGAAAGPVNGTVMPPAERAVPAAVRASLKAQSVTAPAARPRPVASGVPAALRERMSSLTMSLHFYTEEPARRMVRIDNRIVREGQTVADQLVLEEITPTGAIFSFAGARFAVPGPGLSPGEN
jgi:general secretion pathway protein B